MHEKKNISFSLFSIYRGGEVRIEVSLRSPSPPRFLSFIMFAISKNSPRLCICCSPACTTGERGRMSLLWTSPGGEEGKWRNLPWSGWWGWEGKVEGIACASADVPRCHFTSAAEWITRQMFNVKARLSHQANSHTHTHTQPGPAKTCEQYSLSLHQEAWLSERSYQGTDFTPTKKFSRGGGKKKRLWCAQKTHKHSEWNAFSWNSLSLMKCFYSIMHFQTPFDLSLVPAQKPAFNTERQKLL